jgi:membrane-bound lytic murein transglycosylase B
VTGTVVAPSDDDARSIAAAITAAERALRVGDAGDDALAAAGRAEQLAFRRLARHPERQADVLAALPADVAAPVAFIVRARQAVVDHAASTPPRPPASTLPAWRIVAARPVAELLADYREAQRLTGVPWTYLAAIHVIETRTGRIDGASPDGAIGPMQFLPATWASCCTGDIHDPHDAIVGAATFLARHGAPGDMRRALRAYNPNDGYVGEVEAYAAAFAADERAYVGLHGWEVLVGTSVGTVRLPVGYAADQPVDAAAYVAEHPDDLLT